MNNNVNLDNVIIISGPSGAGKGTLINHGVSHNENLSIAISATTRPPRDGEVNGTHYYFLSDSNFDEKINEDAFIEWCHVHKHRYGTLKEEIQRLTLKGKTVMLEIDTQGALKIKKRFPEVKMIFIAPPSLEELKNRLINRNTEKEEEINGRLKIAEKELEEVNFYDVVLVNDNLETATKAFEETISSLKLGGQRVK